MIICRNYPENACIIDTDIRIAGDVIIRLLETNGKEIFHIIFNTSFLDLNHYKINFPRQDIDLIFTGKDKRFNEEFHALLNYVPPVKDIQSNKNPIWDLMRARYLHEKKKRLGEGLDEQQSQRLTLLEDQFLSTSKKVRHTSLLKMNSKSHRVPISSSSPNLSSSTSHNYLANNLIITGAKEKDEVLNSIFAKKKKKKEKWDPFNPPIPAIIPSSLAVVKEGELEVFFPRSKKWKSKWFQLERGFLVRYKTKDGPERGRFDLASFTLQEYEPDKIPFCFQLISETSGEKLIMKASTEFEMQEWLNSILRSKLDPSPEKVGQEEKTQVSESSSLPATPRSTFSQNSEKFNLKNEFLKAEKEWEQLVKKHNEALSNKDQEKARQYEVQANELHQKIVSLRKTMEKQKKDEKEKEDELNSILKKLESEVSKSSSSSSRK